MKSGTSTFAVIAGATFGLAPGALAQSEVDQSRAYQAEMMQEAGARSSYAQGDLTPVLFGQIQIRYTANIRDEAANNDEDFTHGFSNRRTKIGAKGGNDQWKYKVQGGFDRAGGGFRLEDAFVDYVVNDNWFVTVGQFKLPVFYEESMSSTKQLAADRSLANEFVNQDRSQGVMVTWDDGESLRVQVAASDGLATRNTDFNSANEADYGFSARIDWKEGDWRDLEDFTSEVNGNQAMRVGAFGHYQDGGETGGFTAEMRTLILGVDAQWESGGWNAFGSAAWQRTEFEMRDVNGEFEFNDFTFVLQGGYRFDEQDEVFARASLVLLDDDRLDNMGSELEDQVEILIGYNHYFDGHATKFTLDGGVFTENSTDTLQPSDTSVGILPDNDSPQFAIRAQLQLLF